MANKKKTAFTLIELLLVVAIISLLVSILVPFLSSSRENAKNVQCSSQLRQLGMSFTMYASDYKGRVMPLAYADNDPAIYWWGTNNMNSVDHTKGFVWPYLQSPLGAKTVFECPNQKWGTYNPQGPSKQFTSTYGYNGYFLSPYQTPGWSSGIKHRPWQMLDTIKLPQKLFVFADTLIDMGGNLPENNAFLDPPMLYWDKHWYKNYFPTTSFRHRNKTCVALADGHAELFGLEDGTITSSQFNIGTVGIGCDPHYIPDWREW